MPFAVNTVAVATPLVFTIHVYSQPVRKCPFAPGANVWNFTTAPLRGLPFASVTRTASGVANALKIVALCGVPLTGETFAGAAAVFDSRKFAVPVIPATLATTL